MLFEMLMADPSVPCMSAAAQTAGMDELTAMRDMFGEDFAELAVLYLTDSPRRIAALQMAAASKDAAQAARVAHSLSGSCASIGAISLASLCQALEIACKAGNLDRIDSKLQAIGIEYARIDAKLHSMLAS